MLADAVFSVEKFTFVVAGMICLFGAFGVVVARRPVHSALCLVATLFGVAVLFVVQGAYFLAAIQVIVYAGAIVILIMFVMMLLGIDEVETFIKESDPIGLVVAAVLGAGFAALAVTVAFTNHSQLTGQPSAQGALDAAGASDIETIGKALFTDYLFAFEITSVLLTIAVIGAVVLARRIRNEPIDLDEFESAPETGDEVEV